MDSDDGSHHTNSSSVSRGKGRSDFPTSSLLHHNGPIAHAATISQQSLLNADIRDQYHHEAGSISIALTPAHSFSKNTSNNESARSSNESQEAIVLGTEYIDEPGGDQDGTSSNSSDENEITSHQRQMGLIREQHHYRRKPPGQIIKELTIEVMPALLVSVAGSVLAGYILGQIQDSRAFEAIPALFIMVAVLMNLKSNIELNMSTRLSTLANLGVLDNRFEGISAMRSNMELLLLQSTVVGLSVGLISALLSLASSSSSSEDSSSIHKDHGFMDFLKETNVLLAAGLGCSVIGCAVIGVLICGTVATSNALGIDPDNIGTPIASSLGDMTTLLILGAITSMLVAQQANLLWWPLLITVAFLALGFLLVRIVQANEQMAHHITEGWGPLLFAAVTSSIAGLIVERCADRFPGMPALVPVVNGIGGNIGTVFASRLSTSLHRRHSHPAEHNLAMLILLLINIPIQLGFLAMHRFFDPSLVVNFWFIFLYTAATIAHGAALLGIARLACNYLWKHGYDPDDYVNPFITGIGDMLGTILLSLVFIAIP
ncbi:hypothetical protein IW140_006365 [Coemansia sp. RSA 1813]|nr:hypothetical protein EV178_006385 [Coemansia sp. RSA 1646]KAJ1765874.1 hypothetical protein LPJ74_006161 [Coemansia sp. RSA 1843]KAJ2085460.1 hypothetical protein IW138_006318 [Coemansia sp. RSA 986]KAJ2210485.1 hypothetical protein EV179_006206 [Coemansia sp. RSA 487]KAJ2562649.1 hypothetical protein IW140_006365 [Coemansia sp. RSA 1813]